jgi:serine/threonine protein kinase
LIDVFESLNLSTLAEENWGLLRKPSNTRPALWIVEEEGIRAVVKDYSINGFVFRNIIGRFLIWRESKAYRKLKGLPGVPRFYRVIDGLALVMEEIKGRSLEGLEDKIRLEESFFHELRTLIGRFHDRGLAHCDLKRAPNTLLGDDGKPYIVDWSAAISKLECRPFPLHLIYNRFIRDDFNGVIKLQLRHCPESVTPAERERYFSRGIFERIIRSIRDHLRALLQKTA